MEYTRQQMCGHKDFSEATRTGNWREDTARNGERMHDYMQKKANGGLMSQRKTDKLRTAIQSVYLTPQRPDSLLHSGDVIMLQSAQTRGCLAVNATAGSVGRPNHYCVSVAPTANPVVRNAWSLMLAKDPHKDFYRGVKEKQVVHYGQTVRIVNRMAMDHNLNLAASMPSPHTCLKGNTIGQLRGEVTVCASGEMETFWQVVPAEVSCQMEMQGQPVRTGEVVVLKSVKSNQYLSAEAPRVNSFGSEHEVSTFHHKDTFAKKECLTAGPANLWGILCAPAGSHFEPYNEGRSTDAVDRVKSAILKRGGSLGMRGLTRSLRVMDDNGDRKLTRKEFKEGLATYGVPLTTGDLDAVFEVFDRDGDGVVTITEFLRTLRGDLNPRRSNIVMEAYKRLDKDGSGVVTFAELKKIYGENLHRHPAVETGTKTQDEVLLEFVSCWDKSGDGIITQGEFKDYYSDLSCSIDDDDYFELMIRNAWHISGGEGWCENTSCRRVLVTYLDGGESVEEIKVCPVAAQHRAGNEARALRHLLSATPQDDLGIGPEDLDKMRENLEAQGIKNIKKITLHF